jgi:hypothetical protein
VIGTDGREPSPFLVVVNADRDDDALTHLERLTPLLFSAVKAAIADEAEIPSALATSSGVTCVRPSDRIACNRPNGTSGTGGTSYNRLTDWGRFQCYATHLVTPGS